MILLMLLVFLLCICIFLEEKYRLSEAVPMRPFFRVKNGGKLRQKYPQPRE